MRQAPPPERDDGPRRPRRVLALAGGLVLAACTLFALGVILFARSLDRREPHDVAARDGIVVLTGGADRINDAIQLLERGKGRRLVISGVNAQSTPDMLRRRWPGREALFDCCIDLDYRAHNTRQNALESRTWAKDHGFRSLVLVTASYHLPRAMLEFAHAMPGMPIEGFPVVPEASRLRRWWQEPTLMRIIAFEFVKYGAAWVRVRLWPGSG